MSRTILVTGGAGYIGSHTAVELLAAGDDVVIVDNLDNSVAASVDVVRDLTGRPVTFVEADVADRPVLDSIFVAHDIDAVIHFAGLKAVGESVAFPMRYYRNNLDSTITLIEAMTDHDVKRMVFSSSCTVYGEPDSIPITEDSPISAASPYGRTKLIIEDMFRDVVASDPSWHVALLRYFNPVGAHPSGRLGEDPKGVPNNLMPFAMQVAVGRRDKLSVFGGDYPTRDGTCVRDYIHVVDLAHGHLAALDTLAERGPGAHAYNLGTGTGSTVLEVLAAAREAVGSDIPYEIVERRAGDIMEIYADPAFAQQALGWKANLTLADMCRDHWRWQQDNPNGFAA